MEEELEIKELKKNRVGNSFETFSKIPDLIVSFMDEKGLDSSYYYRLLDKIAFSDASNGGRGCIMSNTYFLKEFKTISESKLKRLLRDLEEAGLITRKIFKATILINTRRKIYPSELVRRAWIGKYEREGMAGITRQFNDQIEMENAFNVDSTDEKEETEDSSDDANTGGNSICKPLGVTFEPSRGQNRHIKKNINNNTSSYSYLSSSKEEERKTKEDPPVKPDGLPSDLTSLLPPLERIDLEDFPKESSSHQSKPSPRPTAEALRQELPGANGEPDHKRREIALEGASEEAKTIIDLWNGLGCGRQHDLKGRKAQRALYLLDYYLFAKKGMRVDKIVDAILRFNDMAPYPDRYGLPKKGKMSLEEFLVVPKRLKQRARKWSRPEPISLLRQLYSNNSNGEIDEYTEEDQLIYKKLKRVYATWARGVDQGDTKYSRKEELDLLRAATKLKRCKEKGWLDAFYVGKASPGYDEYVDVLFRGLKRKFGTDYSTGNIASEHTWNDLMPKFIQEDYGASVLDSKES